MTHALHRGLGWRGTPIPAALLAGFEAVVLEDAVRPVDVKQGDGCRALKELRAAGIVLTPATESSVDHDAGRAAHGPLRRGGAGGKR